MLGRRNLRVKVMQELYRWEMDHEIPLQKLEEHLKTQVQKSLSLYLTNLLFLVEVCQHSLVDKAKRLARYIKSEADEKASTTIASNTVIRFLSEDKLFQSFVKKEGINNYLDGEIAKNMFSEISSK